MEGNNGQKYCDRENPEEMAESKAANPTPGDEDTGGGVYPKQTCPHIFSLVIEDCLAGLPASCKANCG